MKLFGKARDPNDRLYGLRYFFKPEYGAFPRDSASKKFSGLADAVVFISLVNTEQGFSQAMFTYDSRNEKRELTDDQLFGVWLTLGFELANRNALTAHLRDFARMTLKSFRDYMRRINAAERAKETVRPVDAEPLAAVVRSDNEDDGDHTHDEPHLD